MYEAFKKGLNVFVAVKEEPSRSRPIRIELERQPEPLVNLEKFKNYFSEKMKSMNMPGPDYCEFSALNQDFKSDIPDERSRFKVVMKSFNRDGLTKEKLISSAKHYLVEFDKDKETFLKTVSEKENQDIGSKKSQISSLEMENKEIEDLIQQKRNIAESNQVKIEKIKSEMVEVEEKIKSNETGYLLAFEETVSIINNDIKKIQELI